MQAPTALGPCAQESELRELRITAKALIAELSSLQTDHATAQVHAWAVLP